MTSLSTMTPSARRRQERVALDAGDLGQVCAARSDLGGRRHPSPAGRAPSARRRRRRSRRIRPGRSAGSASRTRARPGSLRQSSGARAHRVRLRHQRQAAHLRQLDDADAAGQLEPLPFGGPQVGAGDLGRNGAGSLRQPRLRSRPACLRRRRPAAGAGACRRGRSSAQPAAMASATSAAGSEPLNESGAMITVSATPPLCSTAGCRVQRLPAVASEPTRAARAVCRAESGAPMDSRASSAPPRIGLDCTRTALACGARAFSCR